MNVITNIKLASPSEIDSIRTSWRNIPERVYRVAFSDNKVYLVYRGDKMKCEPAFFKRLIAHKNIEIVYT